MKLSQLEPARFEKAFHGWRNGAGPLLPYVKSTPFVSLSRYAGEMELGEGLVEGGGEPAMSEGELLLIDLPAAQGLAAGLRLWRERRLWPVITFATWYHPFGLVGDATTAFGILQQVPQVDGPPEGWCLLTDYGRYVDGELPEDRFNNQYELTEDDLPSVEELRALGYSGLCLWTAEPPKEDLQRYAAYLAEGQLTVRWHR